MCHDGFIKSHNLVYVWFHVWSTHSWIEGCFCLAKTWIITCFELLSLDVIFIFEFIVELTFPYIYLYISYFTFNSFLTKNYLFEIIFYHYRNIHRFVIIIIIYITWWQELIEFYLPFITLLSIYFFVCVFFRSRDLKYEDPFDNPLVKVSKSKSSVEMCGKVYRLAPVTLTQEEQTVHQRRRSRAYQWKRPTVFLKEGDSVPPDVDPDTIRWIPANHPFVTTSTDIGEDFAHKNVNQKHGVPFRIQAEHEALQKKLEALQNVSFSKIRNFNSPMLDMVLEFVMQMPCLYPIF